MKLRLKKMWHLFNELYADYRARLLALAGLGLASGFLEGISISLLVPLFTVFLKGGDFGSNFILRSIGTTLAALHIPLSFRALLTITIVLFVFKTAMLAAFGVLRARVTSHYKTAVRRRLYEGFLGTDFSFLRAQKTGHLTQVITNDVKQGAKLFDDLIGFILSIGNTVMYLTVSFMLSWRITALTACLGGALFFVLMPLVKKTRRYSHDSILLGKGVAHSLAETLYGIKTVKAMGVEQEIAEATRVLFAKVEQAEFRKTLIKLYTKLSFEPVSVFFILAVFVVSYLYLSFDIVSFVAIIYLVNRVFAQVSNMQSGLNVMMESLPSASEIVSVLREVRAHASPPRGTLPFSFERELAVTAVSFNYDPKRTAHALSQIDFRVRKGETIGIIGPSGAGKTTLVDLLLGLLTPAAGSITLDGVTATDIRSTEWRARVLYVAQDLFLRNDTIAENIRFYNPLISDADIARACTQANLDGLIRSLPKGLATVIGERGTRLSGGERQRVALARALARNPAILILDEATSALDAASERMIQETLKNLHGSLTIIIIAHRLTTVMDADRLMVLEQGRIVEEGSPGELVARADSYLSRMLALGHTQPET